LRRVSATPSDRPHWFSCISPSLVRFSCPGDARCVLAVHEPVKAPTDLAFRRKKTGHQQVISGAQSSIASGALAESWGQRLVHTSFILAFTQEVNRAKATCCDSDSGGRNETEFGRWPGRGPGGWQKLKVLGVRRGGGRMFGEPAVRWGYARAQALDWTHGCSRFFE